jgi:response regulator RpfG family c-di-GMP phosphodiesterase
MRATRILRSNCFRLSVTWSQALEIPHWHQGKWNGTGYPDKLDREDIPFLQGYLRLQMFMML